MPHFTDNKNRRWNLALNVSSVRRVRDVAKINLLEILDRPEMLSELAADPIQLVDVLYLICKPQADAAGVSDEAFGEALAGDEIELATIAFLEAMVDFFPGARRAVLRKALDRATMEAAKQETAIRKAIDEGKIDAAMDQAFAAGPNSGK